MSGSQADAELAELRTIVARAREQAMATTSAMRRARAALAPMREQLERERAVAHQDLRNALRNGDLAAEQRALVERLTRGETTWREVLMGGDDHWSATALRDQLATGLGEVVERLREQDDEFRAAHDRLLREADTEEQG
jgi:hypothetical protein